MLSNPLEARGLRPDNVDEMRSGFRWGLCDNKWMRILVGAFTCCVLVLTMQVAPADAPVPAELVYFSSGDVMPIAGHRVEGNAVALTLNGGGEVLFDLQLIDRIEPAVQPGTRPAADPAPAATAVQPLSPYSTRRPYAQLVRAAADRHRVDAEILHAVIEVESGYHADAVSRRGAKGLMQLMPATVERYNVQDPFDPAANIDAGARYLRYLFDQFGMRAGLAAYNAGEGAVGRFHGVPPYRETVRYVDRILTMVDAARTEATLAQ